MSHWIFMPALYMPVIYPRSMQGATPTEGSRYRSTEDGWSIQQLTNALCAPLHANKQMTDRIELTVVKTSESKSPEHAVLADASTGCSLPVNSVGALGDSPVSVADPLRIAKQMGTYSMQITNGFWGFGAPSARGIWIASVYFRIEDWAAPAADVPGVCAHYAAVRRCRIPQGVILGLCENSRAPLLPSFANLRCQPQLASSKESRPADQQ